MKFNNHQKGFTIIELLIATAVFSVLLVVFLTSLIRISQLFYKGISLSNTQEASRNLMQNISDDIQFYHEGPGGDQTKGYFCISDHRYSYKTGVQVGSGDTDDYGVVKEQVAPCLPPTPPSGGGPFIPIDFSKAEKLLDPGMQLNSMSINTISTANGAYLIKIRVVYYAGDKRVFSSEDPLYINDINSPLYNAHLAPDAKCTGIPSSSQFCATADYQTTILQKF